MQQSSQQQSLKRAVVFQISDGVTQSIIETLRGQRIAVSEQRHLTDLRRLIKTECPDFLFIGSPYLIKRGNALVSSIKKQARDLSIIIVVARDDREQVLPLLGVHIMGILLEPFYPKEMLFLLSTAERIINSEMNDRASEELTANFGNPHKVFIGRSPSAHEVRRATIIAKKDGGNVLFIGENGTGKTQLSFCIHMKSKNPLSTHRLYDPLVDAKKKQRTASLFNDIYPSSTLIIRNAQHLAAKEAAQVESILKRGAGGAGKFPRLIIHHDPAFSIAERFDRTLFDHCITIAPLRARTEDICAIFGYYVNCFSSALSISPVTLSAAARKMLMGYPWPKNVRDLIGVVIFVMITSSGVVDPLSLPDFITQRDSDPLERISLENLLESKLKPIVSKMKLDTVEGLYNIILTRVEAPLIKMVLDQTGQNQSKAARILGINRNTLKKKIDEYRIGKQ